MPEILHRNVVQIDIDNPAAKRVEQRVGRLYDALNAIKRASADMSREMGQTSRFSTPALDMVRNRVERLRTELQQTQKVAKSFGQTTIAPKIAAPVATGRLRQQQLSRSAESISSLGMAGDLLGPNVSGITRNIAVFTRAAKGVMILGEDLPKMASGLNLSSSGIMALTAAAVAGGAAFLVARDNIQEWQGAANEAKRSIVGQIGALEDYYAFIGTASRDDLHNKIVEVAEKRKLDGQMLEDLMVLKNAALAGLDVSDASVQEKLGAGAVRAADMLGLLGYGMDELDTAIAKTQTSMRQEETLFNMLNRAFLDNATAGTDDRMALEAANKVRVDSMVAETNYAIQAKTMSADSIRDRIKQLHTEQLYNDALRRDLEKMAPTSEAAATQLEIVNLKMAGFTAEAQALYDALPQAQAADVFNNILGFVQTGAAKITGGVTALTETMDASAQSVDTYRAKMQEVEADRQLTMVRAEQDSALERTRSVADHYRDLATQDAKYYQDRAELIADLGKEASAAEQERIDTLQDYNKEAIRGAKDHARRMFEIQRDAQDDIRNAAARLDAVGIREAQKARERQLDDEQAQYDEQKQQRDEDMQDNLRQLEQETREKKQAGLDQLRDLERQHQSERDQTIRAFNEELRREDENYRIKRQRQDQDWAIQDQKLRDQYGIVEAATGTHYSTITAIATAGMAQTQTAIVGKFMELVDFINKTQIPSGYSGAGVSGGRILPSYGTGSPYVPAGTTAWVGDRGRELVRFMQPGQVYSAQQSRQMSRSISVSFGDIVVSGGGNAREIARLVRREVDTAMKDNFREMAS